MARKSYDVSRVEIIVRNSDGTLKRGTKEVQKVFFRFHDVFKMHLQNYASNTTSTATSQFDVCGYNSKGVLYGNNINFNKSISLSTINKVVKSTENDSIFAIKEIKYDCDSDVLTVSIKELE